MGYLDNKVLIYIVSTNGVKRFFNRNTQGFTVRLYDGRFEDSCGAAINVYFKTFNKHKPSESMWERMLANDYELHYCKTIVKSLKLEGVS